MCSRVEGDDLDLIFEKFQKFVELLLAAAAVSEDLHLVSSLGPPRLDVLQVHSLLLQEEEEEGEEEGAGAGGGRRGGGGGAGQEEEEEEEEGGGGQEEEEEEEGVGGGRRLLRDLNNPHQLHRSSKNMMSWFKGSDWSVGGALCCLISYLQLNLEQVGCSGYHGDLPRQQGNELRRAENS